MKDLKWPILFGFSMVIASIIFYFLHYVIFKDTHHIFIYLIGDVAFVFIEVLLVTLIIHRLLSDREKRARLEKLNMVIGAFFSQVGTKLLTFTAQCDAHLAKIKKELIVSDNWSEKKFINVTKRLKKHDYTIDIKRVHLENLRTFLKEENDFLLRLLENPNLLEHESFTELLRAVFHLTEELIARKDLRELPPVDYEHLSNDIKRAYGLLVHQWLDYVKYLKNNYPYLFSLVIRTNPFNEEASPIVT